MLLRKYLHTRAHEEMPGWLAKHRVGDPFPALSFLCSQVVFYPGSGTDGEPVALFGATHVAHCFVYIDYGLDQAFLERELSPRGHPFRGYETYDRISVRETDLVPTSWKPHAGPQAYGFASTSGFGFVEILQRRTDFGPEHGPSRLAILFLGADGIAVFDALFCQQRDIPPPLAVVVQDHGFGGQYAGGRFGGGGLLEHIALQCGVLPKWLWVARNTLAWRGYEKVPDLEGEPGGVHQSMRYLHVRRGADDRTQVSSLSSR